MTNKLTFYSFLSLMALMAFGCTTSTDVGASKAALHAASGDPLNPIECPPVWIDDGICDGFCQWGCDETDCLDPELPSIALCDDDGGTPPPPAQECGDVTCGDDEYCCNSSCGLCVPFGEVCTQQLCDDGIGDGNIGDPDTGDGDIDAGEPDEGDLGGYTIDAGSADEDDIDDEGDLGGYTIDAGSPDDDDDDFDVDPIDPDPVDPVDPSGDCGDNVCGDGEYCCNASCGICVPEGDFCSQEFCGDDGDDTDPVPLPGF